MTTRRAAERKVGEDLSNEGFPPQENQVPPKYNQVPPQEQASVIPPPFMD